MQLKLAIELNIRKITAYIIAAILHPLAPPPRAFTKTTVMLETIIEAKTANIYLKEPSETRSASFLVIKADKVA